MKSWYHNHEPGRYFTHTIFFFVWIFFHKYSWFTGQQWMREVISLIPLYHFHPLHRHLDISRTITAESSPLHIASRWTWTRYLWFPIQLTCLGEGEGGQIGYSILKINDFVRRQEECSLSHFFFNAFYYFPCKFGEIEILLFL